MASNFAFMTPYSQELASLGTQAEVFFRASDYDACVKSLAAMGESLVSGLLRENAIACDEETAQADKITLLRSERKIPQSVEDILFALMTAEADNEHSSEDAKMLLRLAYKLCCWWMQVYGYQNAAEEVPLPDFEMPESTDENIETASDDDASDTSVAEEAPEECPDGEEQPTPENSVNDEEPSAAGEGANGEERLPAESDNSDNEPPAEDEKTDFDGKVRMTVDALGAVSYALMQNGLKMLRSVSVQNDADEAMENAVIEVTSRPGFCLPYREHIERIPPHAVFTVDTLQPVLDGDYLAGMTEKISGVLEIKLSCGNSLLCSQTVGMDVLAFDQWHGVNLFPELLCAFVTPNHPEVIKIAARAAEFLGKWTGDPSLDGYQSNDANRVLKQMAAVYAAMQEQNIVYSMPPASVGVMGQRVRLCDAVIQQKLGTCLDLTLFYAAVIESIGLHPLLIVQTGHIFAGVWLEDMAFAESVQDDVSLVTKRLASGINEIAVVECTAFVADKNASFDDAMKAAQSEVADSGAFECLIDVSRARLSGIHPLPQRVQMADGWRVERPRVEERDLTDAPKERAGAVDVEDAFDTPVTRKSRWERKLLDLGLRNSLINLRLSKSLIPVLTTSVDDLEDSLADGEDFSIQPLPADWHLKGDLNFEMMHELGELAPVIQSEFKNHRLRSAMTEGELSKAIKELYRSARTALEENGANTLYMALGLLRWYENPRSTKPRYAPLILVPIEMVRKSASQGYVIRLREDEPQMNVTILEKLKQDFQIVINGLDILPEDEHGIDTRKVFTVVRKAVMEQKNWDVLESAYLGIFSFSQFVMWNDIRSRYDDLAKNKIVRSLMDGKLAWDAEEMEIGQQVDESGVFLPMPADASQLYAIKAASEGKSFVLHGPPGTGKSQTITALIANALALGKSVLFVAEKMAALEVVQKRLESIGIGDFCLELHSNKAKKKNVLEQLRRASEVTRKQSAQAYENKAAQIAKVRAELNQYAEELHKTQLCGQSLYDLINEYEVSKEYPDLPPFDRDLLDSLDAVRYDDNLVLVQRLIAAAREIGHPAGHPLADVTETGYSQQLRMNLPAKNAAFRESLTALEQAAHAFCEATGLPVSTYAQLEKAAAFAQEMKLWLTLPGAWAQAENVNLYIYRVREMCEHHIKAGMIADGLSAMWKPEFLSLDGMALLNEYRTASAKWFLPRMIGVNALVKKLAPYAARPIQKEGLEAQLAQLTEYRTETDEARKLFDQYGDGLGSLFDGDGTNWVDIRSRCDSAKESAGRLLELCGSDEFRRQYCSRSDIAPQMTAFMEAWSGMQTAKAAFDTQISVAAYAGDGWASHDIALCNAIEERFDELREWMAWNSIAAQTAQNGLGCVVNSYRGGMAHEEIEGSYKKSLSRSLIMKIIDATPVLNGFSGAVFNEKIEQFRQMDKDLAKLTQQEIFCRLAAKVPNFAKEAAQSSELGILQKAIRSGGRGMSIRRLFDQIPNMLPRLCPCMLMSPISAAQYLAPNREPFDLVVFDEASQITTSKAVGALARGKNAVIVGDPKQMPPTSFFAVNAVDEENMEDEDLESILDDCLALNLPQTHLLWHYRSRHESLIAFSNRHFYENKLYTFPSVNDREAKVRLVHTDGAFDRGKSRQNRSEAEAVIAELKRRCHDKKASALSVGVVTFNINQQNLIDDLLNEACKEDSALESWVYNGKEPLFIKNLENVQGDERDVILFSIGYGPDKDGRVSMNFGPLNRDGGWRRLNVAVSRARCEMVVFSTLLPEQINLNRTSAEGVAALRAFLEYAQGKDLAQDSRSVGRGDDREGVSKAICAALEEQGYETQRMVGHSQYHIDIGVVDPCNPERYRLGILLDGATYRDSKTVRDRELAQISVLNSLGWKITRVWSMDWWDNSKKELARLLDLLEREKEASEAQVRDAADAEKNAADDAAEETQAPAENAESPEGEKTALPDDDAAPSETTETVENDAATDTAEEYADAMPSVGKLAVYTAAALKSEVITPEDFVSPANAGKIRKKIQAVIEAEAPVSEGLLTRKVVQSFGITRSGSRIQNYITSLYLSMKLKSTIQNADRFFWKPEQEKKSYAGLRVNGEGDNKRDVRDIPMQEAANAVCLVLYDQISMSHGDLVKEAAKMMGYTRSGNNVTSVFEAAIQYADTAGWLMLDSNGNCKLSEGGMDWALRVASSGE